MPRANQFLTITERLLEKKRKTCIDEAANLDQAVKALVLVRSKIDEAIVVLTERLAQLRF